MYLDVDKIEMDKVSPHLSGNIGSLILIKGPVSEARTLLARVSRSNPIPSPQNQNQIRFSRFCQHWDLASRETLGYFLPTSLSSRCEMMPDNNEGVWGQSGQGGGRLNLFLLLKHSIFLWSNPNPLRILKMFAPLMFWSHPEDLFQWLQICL